MNGDPSDSLHTRPHGCVTETAARTEFYGGFGPLQVHLLGIYCVRSDMTENKGGGGLQLSPHW